MLPWWGWVLVVVVAFVVITSVLDAMQRKRSIVRNFPFFGRFRYLFESLGPPLRQYIVTSDLIERPFNRLQRNWAYKAAKGELNSMPFGTQLDLDAPGIIKFNPSAFPTYDVGATDHCEPITLGSNRAQPFPVKHVANVSGMSYGSLSKNAVLALSRGVKIAGGYMNTGEGGCSPYHLEGGGDLMFQLGPAKFGCRNPEGKFDPDKFSKLCENPKIRAIELKLSQGAKPGKGGVLPKEKISKEISEIRGVPQGKDCHSPNRHEEVNDIASLMEFVDRLRTLSGGKPVGFKTVLGGEEFIRDVSRYIADHDDGPDFITIDGAEGGTGAAPMSLSDHMGISLQEALVITDNHLREAGARDKVLVIGSGRCITGAEVAIALGLGADLVHIARGFMFALGCIQALQCDTNHCPTGVATNNKWLVRGLVPSAKDARVANYMEAIHHDVMMVARALGVTHPREIQRHHMSMIVEPGRRVALTEIYPSTMKAFHETRIIHRDKLPAA